MPQDPSYTKRLQPSTPQERLAWAADRVLDAARALEQSPQREPLRIIQLVARIREHDALAAALAQPLQRSMGWKVGKPRGRPPKAATESPGSSGTQFRPNQPNQPEQGQDNGTET